MAVIELQKSISLSRYCVPWLAWALLENVPTLCADIVPWPPWSCPFRGAHIQIILWLYDWITKQNTRFLFKQSFEDTNSILAFAYSNKSLRSWPVGQLSPRPYLFRPVLALYHKPLWGLGYSLFSWPWNRPLLGSLPIYHHSALFLRSKAFLDALARFSSPGRYGYPCIWYRGCGGP